MKHHHKETQPTTVPSKLIHDFNIFQHQTNDKNSVLSPTVNDALSPNDQFLAKRRSANHPCPVCGKHYVNEGSLRKHLACHPETSQLANSLRMWPCSVCQAVFTHEAGKLA